MKYNALMLVAEGNHAVLKMEVNGQWLVLIKERLDSPFSHIIEPAGIESEIHKHHKEGFFGTDGPIKTIAFKCEKLTFATKSIAKDSLKQIRESKGEHKKPIRVYECPICSGWHLTSKPIDQFKRKIKWK